MLHTCKTCTLTLPSRRLCFSVRLGRLIPRAFVSLPLTPGPMASPLASPHLPTFLSGMPPLVLASFVLASTIVVAAWMHKRKMTQKPLVSCQPNAFNTGVLSRMPTLRSLFRPLPFLTNGHVETIFAALVRARIDLEYRREYIFVAEGGVVALDWRAPHADDLVRYHISLALTSIQRDTN
jgi:hypothetical protein